MFVGLACARSCTRIVSTTGTGGLLPPYIPSSFPFVRRLVTSRFIKLREMKNVKKRAEPGVCMCIRCARVYVCVRVCMNMYKSERVSMCVYVYIYACVI